MTVSINLLFSNLLLEVMMFITAIKQTDFKLCISRSAERVLVFQVHIGV